MFFVCPEAFGAKGYTFTDISQPTGCSASAVSGGSLNANTTYYYRIYKVATASSGNTWMGKSLPSDEFSVTTTSTNKTARITFTCPNESRSYRIFRATSSGGMINGYYPCIAFYPSDTLYNSGGTVTFDDTGYAVGGNNYMETIDNAHGRLVLSGSTSSDKFSIVDLYNADVAAGWGVIQRLDVNTYKVNCYLVGHTGLYWYDVDKIIIFSDAVDFNYTNSVLQFGYKASGTYRTKQGCTIVITSSWGSTITFPTLYAYQTIFKYVFPFSTSNLGLTGGGFSAGELIDVQIDRWRNFFPYGGALCTLRGVVYSRGDNCFNTYGASFTNINVYDGSRVWQTRGNSVITGRGVYISGIYAILWIGLNNTVNLIDCEITSDASFGGNVNSTATGSVIYDKLSLNMNIVDENGDPIEGALIQVYCSDNPLIDPVIVETTTDSNGDIDEQFLTRRYRTVTGVIQSSITNLSPFTYVISKDGYETYTEIVDYTVSKPIIKTICLKQAKPVLRDMFGKLFTNLDQENTVRDFSPTLLRLR